MEFGFLLDKHKFNTGNIEIKPLPDIDDKIQRFYQHACVSNGWIYPPLEKVTQTLPERSNFLQSFQIPSKFFTIEPTHSITITPSDDEKTKFLILAYGFLHGLYLCPDGNLYLKRVPYQVGRLTGLTPHKDDYQKGMHTFSKFYDNATKNNRKLIFAIKHWFLVGQTYEYPWDRFDAQYRVLDAVFRLSRLNANNHAHRPIVLAQQYGIQLPDWAKLYPNGKASKLSHLRNELVHEAKYAEKPIGYALPGENYDLEFANFNVKLIAAVCGLNAPVIAEDCSIRGLRAWNLA